MKRYAVGCLLSIGLVSSTALQGQELSSNLASNASPVDYAVSAGITLLHANIAPGQCGCFSMYGGNIQLTARFTPRLSLIADIGATRAGRVSGVDRNFTLSTYQAGMRYSRTYRMKYKPYVQVLAGVAHLDSNFVIDSGLTRGAYSGGGGLDYRITDRFDIRILEAMYVGTPFNNGSNSQQNQLRLTSGLVFHLSKSKDETKPHRLAFIDRERKMGRDLAASFSRHIKEYFGKKSADA